MFKDEGVMPKDKVAIAPKLILCHPKNRAEFMLNGFNAQANAVRVKQVGANRAELHGACVVELSPFPSEKEAQLSANMRVADNSGGLVAPPSGDERYLSIGTGHMVCFCRAANHGCRSAFAELKGADGTISLDIL